MAVETGGIPPQVIAEWIQYGAAFVVAVVAGLAGIFGWTRAKDSNSAKKTEIIASIVDKDTAKLIVDALDLAIENMNEIHEYRVRKERRQADFLAEVMSDVRQLTRTLREISETIKSQHSG